MVWYEKCGKVPWQPPDYVFGIVWPILYILYGIVFYMGFKNTEIRNILLLGLLLNIAWVPVYSFDVKIALVVLTAMIVVSVKTVLLLKGIKMWLFTPYLLWLCFAWTLNTYLALNCK